MFADHGAFIIGFSVARDHLAIAPEAQVISLLESEIEEAGYSHTRELFRIKWADDVNLDPLGKIIAFNIEDNKELKGFWRP